MIVDEDCLPVDQEQCSGCRISDCELRHPDSPYTDTRTVLEKGITFFNDYEFGSEKLLGVDARYTIWIRADISEDKLSLPDDELHRLAESKTKELIATLKKCAVQNVLDDPECLELLRVLTPYTNKTQHFEKHPIHTVPMTDEIRIKMLNNLQRRIVRRDEEIKRLTKELEKQND